MNATLSALTVSSFVAWSLSSVDFCSLRRYSVKLLKAIGDDGSLCLWDRGLCTSSFQRDPQKKTCGVCFKLPGWTEDDVKVGACITLSTQGYRCGHVINKWHHEVSDFTLGAKSAVSESCNPLHPRSEESSLLTVQLHSVQQNSSPAAKPTGMSRTMKQSSPGNANLLKISLARFSSVHLEIHTTQSSLLWLIFLCDCFWGFFCFFLHRCLHELNERAVFVSAGDKCRLD